MNMAYITVALTFLHAFCKLNWISLPGLRFLVKRTWIYMALVGGKMVVAAQLDGFRRELASCCALCLQARNGRKSKASR